jgi:large subunit ribosomal protein L10
MALTKADKQERVTRLARELEGPASAIVGTFQKLTVSQDFALRKAVRGAGGRYRVLKNKLAARASQGTKIEQALQGLKGVSSVAYTSGDPVALAKALSTWVQENAEFTFKLGIVDGKLLSVEEVKQLATMPGKEEIFAKLLYLISAPAQRLVTVINAAGRDLAVVVNQAVEQGKFSGGASETAESAPAAGKPAVEAPAELPSQTAAAAVEAPVEVPSQIEVAAVEAPAEVPSQTEAAATEAAAEVPSQTEAAATEAPVEG